jgi:hypothetical protein
MLYTIGRAWVEDLRIDDAHRWLGLRLNDWTALIVFLCALAYFVLVKNKPTPVADPADGTDGEAGDGSDSDTALQAGEPDAAPDDVPDAVAEPAPDAGTGAGVDPAGDIGSGHTLAT